MFRANAAGAGSGPTAWVRTPAYHDVVRAIRARGPIPFSDFMQIALYGTHGYYTTPRDRRSDYRTSPQTHPEFGACVSRCLERMWHAFGEPTRFRVIELGAGDGSLMRDVLRSIRDAGGESDGAARFALALDYSAHDIAPAGADVDSLPTSETLDGLRRQVGDVHCVLSNELLDAFPTDRFVIKNGAMFELLVDVGESGRLCEVVGSEADVTLVPQLWLPISEFPDGYTGEFTLGIERWVADVARTVERGYVLTIDYGHPREALYHPSRVGGTLRSYSDQVLGSDPFRRVGETDLTAHVDLTRLSTAMAAHGFEEVAPLMSQADFLELHGYDDAVSKARREWSSARDPETADALRRRMADLRALVDPRGLGSFLVAIHGKGVPNLCGLNVLE